MTKHRVHKDMHFWQPIASKTYSSWQEGMPDMLRKKLDLDTLESFFLNIFICWMEWYQVLLPIRIQYLTDLQSCGLESSLDYVYIQTWQASGGNTDRFLHLFIK